ncbi:MAG: hypothetical protein ABI691_09635 [Ginsengibacter sp.]
MPEENEHWVSILINSMAAKIIAFSLLGLLTIAVGVGLFTNKHVNILGIEFNEKIVEKQNSKDTISQHTIIHDTIEKKVYEKNPVIKTVKEHASQPILSQKTDSGTNQANINNCINNGSIGNNNTNFFDKIKDHPTPRILHQIDGIFKNKNEDVKIEALFSGAGSIDFADELAAELKKMGYKNVSVILSSKHVNPPRKGVSLDTSHSQKILLVDID